MKLAVMPAESDSFPRLAEQMNGYLSAARVRGVEEYFRPRVALEVAQISVECIEPTDICYKAVGLSIAANRLLFASIEGEAKKGRNLHVLVQLFDVDSGTTVRKAERWFRSEKEAAQRLKSILDEALSPPPRAATALPARRGG